MSSLPHGLEHRLADHRRVELVADARRRGLGREAARAAALAKLATTPVPDRIPRHWRLRYLRS